MTGNLWIWTVLYTLGTIVFASSTAAASAQHHHDSRTLKSSNFAFPRHHRLSPAHLQKDNTTSFLSARSHRGKSIIGNQKDIHDEPFDYLIVGGGIAGLTLAGRLTEDPSIRVLVLEAGHDGYDAGDNLLVPNAAYWNSAVGGKLDWNYFTKNQKGLWGRVTPWPRGRTLGGSAAVDELYYVRHGTREGEMFARRALELGDVQGSSWTWNKVKEAYQKSSHYRSRSESAALLGRDDGDEWEADFVKHEIGSPEGPVQLSYSRQHFDVNKKWIPAFEELGIGKARDPYDGDNLGPFVAPTTMDSRSWTRSFSRTAYLDDVADRRSNLQVITGHTVTKILFEGAKDDEVVEGKRRKRQQGERRAVGVEFASGPNKDRHTVKARREVILSAGAIATPQILQLSGVGERKLLREYDIEVVKDLPGVGHHLQDHLSIPLMHHVEDGVRLQNKDDKSYTDSAIAYLTLKDLFADQGKANDFLDRARRMTEEYLQHNTSNVPSAVKKGYARALHTLTNDLLSENSASGFGGSPKGAMEILLSTMHDKITLQNALQAPFSRGSIKINSKDPFDHPTIDPHYLSHPADGELLARALSLSRKLAKTKALGPLITKETDTTSKIEGPPTFKTWESHIRLHAATEYHPSSSCSMAPEDEGGVVDAELKVYGFKNLRIVDASIVGQSPSSHLVSYVYSLGEIAAEKIKADRR